MEPVHVLHVLPSLTLAAGGPPVVAVNIARALKAANMNTSLYATSLFHRDTRNIVVDDPPPGLADLDVHIFPLGSLKRLAFSRELRTTLQNSACDYDVVHIHMLFQYPQFAAFQAAERFGVPYIVSPHGALDPFLRKRGRLRKWAVDRVFQRRMMDRAGALHYTTGEEHELVKDLAFKAPARVIPNGVDVASFARRPDIADIQAVRADLKLSEGPLIVNHGRLDPKKGLPILIQALVKIKAKQPGAQLVLIGPDSRGHKADLEELVEDLGLAMSVKFAGLRKGPELLSLVHSADAWVLPSHSENFGYAVIEAMAAGTPVITSPHVNVAPSAAQAGALRMVDNEPEAVASALLDLLQDPICLRDLGQRGQAYAQQFDWLEVGKQYVDLYAEVIQRHRRGRLHG